jgi:UDP:flavonoid glycosyltransferase YjiC (YdhE family)
MARFLVGTMAAHGHVNPGLPIARKLVERGHEVWWYTGKSFQPAIEATGARYVPMKTAPDYRDRSRFSEEDVKTIFRDGERLTGLARVKWEIKLVFYDPIPGQVHDLEEVLREFPADVLLADPSFVGASCIHERGGPPWAAYGLSVLTFSSRDTAPFSLGLLPSNSAIGRLRNRILHLLLERVLLRDVSAYLNMIRGRLGLPPTRRAFFENALSPFLYLQGSTRAFEYPRSDLPPQVHFIGPFLPVAPEHFTSPAWWDDLKTGQPVVHVTQGTVATHSDDLIVPTIKALAGEGVLVVATTGGKSVDSVKLESLPSNVRIEEFIPYYYLMPHVDVMVTNGGYGGVQCALANGVPLVIAGQTEDKAEIANRVAWTGVGINLKTSTPKPEQILEAVRKVMGEPEYKRSAMLVQAEVDKHDAPHDAAELLEQFAETKEPVLHPRRPRSA